MSTNGAFCAEDAKTSSKNAALGLVLAAIMALAALLFSQLKTCWWWTLQARSACTGASRPLQSVPTRKAAVEPLESLELLELFQKLGHVSWNLASKFPTAWPMLNISFGPHESSQAQRTSGRSIFAIIIFLAKMAADWESVNFWWFLTSYLVLKKDGRQKLRRKPCGQKSGQDPCRPAYPQPPHLPLRFAERTSWRNHGAKPRRAASADTAWKEASAK